MMGWLRKLVAWLVVLTLLSSCQRKSDPWVFRSIGMDAAIEVKIADSLTEEEKLELANKISAAIKGVEMMLSLQMEGSMINQLNKDRLLIGGDPRFYELLERCEKWHDETGKLFDVTVQPLWQWYWQQSQLEWDQQSDSIPESVLATIGMEHVLVENGRVSFTKAEVELTLNAIGQGVVTDAIYDVLVDYGVKSALIDAGEYRAVGTSPWTVQFQRLERDGSVELWGEVELSSGAALAVSSGSGYVFTTLKAEPGHIMHPSGTAAEALPDTVAVLAKDATSADALATALCLASEEERQSILMKNYDTKVWFDDRP